MRELVSMTIAFLIGGFPTGVLLSRFVHKRDIRHFGSNNPGAINIWRVFGLRYGLVVMGIDVGKGYFAPVVLPELVLDDYSTEFAVLLGLLVVTGHVWSPWTRFRGGKGVATAFGAAIAVFPASAAICIPVWLAILLLTRYASVASLTTAAVYPIVVYWMHDAAVRELALASALPLLLFYTHRSNLQRLRNGEDLKVWGDR